MKKPIRIATVYSHMGIGGDENRLINYLAARNTDRFEHIVIPGLTPSIDSESICGPIIERVRELGIEVVDLGVPADQLAWTHVSNWRRSRGQLSASIRLMRGMTKLFKDRRIDIVDARLNTGTILGAFAGRAAGVRAVVSTDYQLERFQNWLWKPLGQAAYGMVDALVCDSNVCLDRLRNWIIRPPPGFCIPNGIAPTSSLADVGELKIELGIPENAVVVAQVARLERSKGQDLLVASIPAVAKAVPEAYFLICGYEQRSPEYRAELEATIRVLGVEDRTRIVSYPGAIGDIWALSTLHVHPTRLDSSPIAILEAMAAGIPSVTTKVGGIPELVADGHSGIVLPPDNEKALSDAIIRLLNNRDEIGRLGSNAVDRYTRRHTPEAMAAGIEQVFDFVLHKDVESK